MKLAFVKHVVMREDNL